MEYTKFERVSMKGHPLSRRSSTGTFPRIAIQMNALRDGDQVGLVVTAVLDQASLGSSRKTRKFERSQTGPTGSESGRTSASMSWTTTIAGVGIGSNCSLATSRRVERC